MADDCRRLRRHGRASSARRARGSPRPRQAHGGSRWNAGGGRPQPRTRRRTQFCWRVWPPHPPPPRSPPKVRVEPPPSPSGGRPGSRSPSAAVVLLLVSALAILRPGAGARRPRSPGYRDHSRLHQTRFCSCGRSALRSFLQTPPTRRWRRHLPWKFSMQIQLKVLTLSWFGTVG